MKADTSRNAATTAPLASAPPFRQYFYNEPPGLRYQTTWHTGSCDEICISFQSPYFQFDENYWHNGKHTRSEAYPNSCVLRHSYTRESRPRTQALWKRYKASDNARIAFATCTPLCKPALSNSRHNEGKQSFRSDLVIALVRKSVRAREHI